MTSHLGLSEHAHELFSHQSSTLFTLRYAGLIFSRQPGDYASSFITNVQVCGRGPEGLTNVPSITASSNLLASVAIVTRYFSRSPCMTTTWQSYLNLLRRDTKVVNHDAQRKELARLSWCAPSVDRLSIKGRFRLICRSKDTSNARSAEYAER